MQRSFLVIATGCQPQTASVPAGTNGAHMSWWLAITSTAILPAKLLLLLLNKDIMNFLPFSPRKWDNVQRVYAHCGIYAKRVRHYSSRQVLQVSPQVELHGLHALVQRVRRSRKHQ